MGKVSGPDLKKYMDKRLSLKLNGNRRVSGFLRGFDQFMNITLEESVEEISATEQNRIGMVVSCYSCISKSSRIIHGSLIHWIQVIRGNSIVQFECLEHL